MVSYSLCDCHHNTYGNTYDSVFSLKHGSQGDREWMFGPFHPLEKFAELRLCSTHLLHETEETLRRALTGSFWPVLFSCAALLPFRSRMPDLLRTMTRTISTDKILYSVPEAASLLSLSRGTVYKLISSGRLVAVYPTSKARISAESLHRYVALLEKEQRQLTQQFARVLA